MPLPWSLLATVLLPQRVSGFTVDQLDLLAAAGRIVWVGQGRLGKRDGRIVLYRREQAARVLPPEPAEAPTGVLAAAILTHLEQRGASFLVELETAVRGACPGATGADFRAALWELVWAGLVTNDTFAPLRALGRPLPRTARGRQRAGQPLAGGRWSLVRHLRDPRLGETERTLARAEMLLERYGIVSREAAQGEELAGRFGPLYKVLQAMEEAGRCVAATSSKDSPAPSSPGRAPSTGCGSSASRKGWGMEEYRFSPLSTPPTPLAPCSPGRQPAAAKAAGRGG